MKVRAFKSYYEDSMICFTKVQSKNMKMTRSVRLFTFYIICSFFFKCDDFTVLQIKYLSYDMVVILWILSFANMIIWQKNYIWKKVGWIFIGRFKVGSVPGMRNKEVQALFLYKPAWKVEKLFTLKSFEIYYCMCIEERGG